MEKAKFVYVTYISTTAEKLWDALTNPDQTVQWMSHRNISEWRPGSTWKHQRPDAPYEVDVEGKVVEAVPPTKLVVTWVDPDEAGDPNKHSRVTYEIEPSATSVKLTVIHEDLEVGSGMHKGVTHGWPLVLSSLKSLLETGKALPQGEHKCGSQAQLESHTTAAK